MSPMCTTRAPARTCAPLLSQTQLNRPVGLYLHPSSCLPVVYYAWKSMCGLNAFVLL
ncbi:hypothetical protein SCLCIDRAFT_20266 [Scleroderma citrinum Foug A]|uniref:Uncharacterized protein n=1 Tax=Scleroderma citrinum Foug A TaxID=1036808 RepID=A0A0C3ATR6_9AGAM|nr:hypothetical protein SCLCIDRAFT_20266 [Scleroderma citrinum Foug A]